MNNTVIAQSADVGDQPQLPRGTMRIIEPGEQQWPQTLSAPGTGEVPDRLWVLGEADLSQLSAKSLTLTGMRAPTEYGIVLANDLAREMAEAGWIVVNTGGYGIDEAALSAALVIGTPAIVVLAGGFDHLHPTGHRGLYARIVEAGGLLVSPHAPEVVANRSTSMVSNRLAAMLTLGTVIVEGLAKRRDGILDRAAHSTVELGRPLMAVPGPVPSACSALPNDLIRRGLATMVTCGDDIQQVLAGEDDRRFTMYLGQLFADGCCIAERVCTTASARRDELVAALLECYPDDERADEVEAVLAPYGGVNADVAMTEVYELFSGEGVDLHLSELVVDPVARRAAV